jgi:hypothetical protein
MKPWVLREFLKHSSSRRRMVPQMFRQQACNPLIAFRALSQLMQDFVDEVGIGRSAFHELFSQRLLCQHAIHQWRIRGQRMSAR